ncbi:MAG TPA: hypothetical protein VK858_01020, partial [Longimicrobiales bacterium]|nr:hypothetical protein [Longimicrobiales bacterium]
TWGEGARLVPEVEIGVLDGADEYMFGSIVSLAAAADGTIYVMDRQALALRVYEPDGTLGTVTAPQELSPYPTPVFRGDEVIAVTRDDLGVQRVVRFWVVPGGAAGDG